MDAVLHAVPHRLRSEVQRAMSGVQNEPFRVEGVNVQTFTLQEASERICDDVSSGKAFSVFTLNLDHIVKLRRNSAFRAAYERARIVLADGFPIVLSGRLQGRRVERTTGADLIEPLCAPGMAPLTVSCPGTRDCSSQPKKASWPYCELIGDSSVTSPLAGSR